MSTRRGGAAAGEMETRLPLVLIGGLLILRLIFLFRHAVDSDEPQHLHVIYGWLMGRIPYLDRFDNHTPLFAWMFLPLAAVLGETPDVVMWARVAQIPLSFGVVGLLFLLGRRLFGTTVALWTVALSLALADWSLKSIEFRPDVLWTGLLFLALLVLARHGGAVGWRAFLLAGLLLGAALAASIKTSFLMAALCLGWGTAWGLSPAMRGEFGAGRIAACAEAGLCGFLVVPACFAGWLAAHDALPAAWFALVEVNQPDPAGLRMLWFLAGAPIAVVAGARLVRGGWIRAAVFLTAAFYALMLAGFSPSLKKQTFLPAYPLLIMGAVALWDRRRIGGVAAPAGICVALTAHQLAEGSPWLDGMQSQRKLISETLALTGPEDPVLDLKGETVFRRRPVYLAYVLATTRGIQRGRLEDPGPGRLSETATAVVSADGAGFPGPLRKFMKDNYVTAGSSRLRVAGKPLKPSWEDGVWIERVEVPVAGDYLVLKDGVVEGERRVDAPGTQVFEFGADRSRRLLYWKPAWEAGFRPEFDKDPLDGG